MRWILVTLLAALCACRADLAVSPPREQRTTLDPTALGPFVRMNQINAERHLVSGVYQLEDNAWRWCAGRAALRLRLGPVDNLKFVMRYSVPVQVMQRAGAVRLRILLNGKLWEETRYDKDGIYEIDKPVPANLLLPNADNHVTIEIDKPLPPDAGRPEYGFILVHAGFQPA